MWLRSPKLLRFLSPSVIKVKLNSHSITRTEKAILDAYRYDDEKSIFRKLKKTPYYSSTSDGIFKFSHRMNGMYMVWIDDDYITFSILYCLNKIKDGVADVCITHEIISDVASVVASYSSANYMVGRQFIVTLDRKKQTISILFFQATLKLVSW